MERAGSKGAFTIFAAVDALVSSASLACAASLSRLDGGNGGSEAWPNGGGNFRPSTDPRLGVDESVLLFSERDDMVDLTDSPELRRATNDCVEGLLGGRAGDSCVCSESRRGSGGARPRAGAEEIAFSFSELVLWGRVGGAFFAGRAGTAGLAAPSAGAWVGVREGGRLGGGGGGGLLEGAVKFLCLLRAAILSERELNVCSSVSAIVFARGRDGIEGCAANDLRLCSSQATHQFGLEVTVVWLQLAKVLGV